MKGQRLTNLLLGIIAICLVLIVVDNYTDEPAHAQTSVKVDNNSGSPIPVYLPGGFGGVHRLGTSGHPLSVEVSNFPHP